MIITGAIVILIIVLPILYVNRKRIKSEQKFKNRLINLAAESNGTITECARWLNSSIAVDKNQHLLFFIKDVSLGETRKTIDLKEIQKCRVINTSRSIKGQDGSNVVVIDRLELGLTYKMPNCPEEKLEFYNTDSGTLTITDELMLVEKWKLIINNELMTDQ